MSPAMAGILTTYKIGLPKTLSSGDVQTFESLLP
jgi:hypothetical protein